MVAHVQLQPEWLHVLTPVKAIEEQEAAGNAVIEGADDDDDDDINVAFGSDDPDLELMQTKVVNPLQVLQQQSIQQQQQSIQQQNSINVLVEGVCAHAVNLLASTQTRSLAHSRATTAGPRSCRRQRPGGGRRSGGSRGRGRKASGCARPAVCA
jgi:hypothetical protein